MLKSLATCVTTLLCVVIWLPSASAADAAAETLIQAIRKNDVAGMERQLKAVADANARADRDTTPLMYAAACGSLGTMRALVGAGADVNAKNAFNATALLWCANDIDKVRLPVGKGADVNAASKQGRTPLMVAAAYDGSEEIVKFLLAKGAPGLRSMQLHGPEGRKVEFEQRIRRAGQWLLNATATYNEERNMQLLGLKWSGADQQTIDGLAQVLIAEQRADGGWSQNANLGSDAYATAESLYALNQAAGIPTASPVYQRGLSYLLRTQLDDGSWHVRSRAVKLQPYFQSGFPDDHDQWISATSTAWASAAILLAIDRPASVAPAGTQ